MCRKESNDRAKCQLLVVVICDPGWHHQFHAVVLLELELEESKELLILEGSKVGVADNSRQVLLQYVCHTAFLFPAISAADFALLGVALRMFGMALWSLA